MMDIAVAGLGAIGMKVAREIDGGAVPGLRLAMVSGRDPEKTAAQARTFTHVPEVVGTADLGRADVVVDCAPKAALRAIAEAALGAGKVYMPLSVGAMLDHMDLVDIARANGGRIVVPTGALIGLDTVRAMAEGQIHTVTLTTRKPPAGLLGAPHLEEHGIDVLSLTEPTRVFAGNAYEAAKGFPANVNVAAALSLAGSGPEATTVEVWAVPGLERNQQSVRITSDSGEAEMTIWNIPSDENPRTGKITALSTLAALRRMTAPLVSGT